MDVRQIDNSKVLTQQVEALKRIRADRDAGAAEKVRAALLVTLGKRSACERATSSWPYAVTL